MAKKPHGPGPRRDPVASVAEGQDAVLAEARTGRADGSGSETTAAGPVTPQVGRQWQSDFEGLPAGRQSHVRTAASGAELRGLFDRWTEGAEAQPARGPKIHEVYRLADGTIIQWRLSSRSGGETIDIFRPGERDRKVHLE